MKGSVLSKPSLQGFLLNTVIHSTGCCTWIHRTPYSSTWLMSLKGLKLQRSCPYVEAGFPRVISRTFFIGVCHGQLHHMRSLFTQPEIYGTWLVAHTLNCEARRLSLCLLAAEPSRSFSLHSMRKDFGDGRGLLR